MADAWKLLLLTLALAGVYCARRTQPWLRYEDIITEALRVYNDAQRGRPLFRLVEATLPFRLNSTARVPLNFRIRQTVCISTWERLQQSESCAFQEGGEERICTGLFSKVRLRRSLTISCDRDCGRRDQVSPRSPSCVPPAGQPVGNGMWSGGGDRRDSGPGRDLTTQPGPTGTLLGTARPNRGCGGSGES
uniref:Uncharacterized protein n=1 Tax=Cavia porcellus TaxID=10141 RepID=A0A286X971_CAVPO